MKHARAIAVFFAVAFGFSWAIGFLVHLLGPTAPALARVGLLVLYMFGPALGAVAAQRLVAREPIRPIIGALSPGKTLNRWWLVAWLAPFALAFGALGVGALMPGVSIGFDVDTIAGSFADAVPADQLDAARAQLSSIPLPAMIAIMIVQALIAGLSINAVAAFGEELGWRGFLYERWCRGDHAALWRGALAVGAVWGAWHAPIILQGHNYPHHPVAGVPMMIVFCVLVAPWLAYVRARTGSVLAASIMHGTVNATAGFAFLFLRGGNDLLVGVTGLAGFLVLAVADLALFFYTRTPAAARA